MKTLNLAALAALLVVLLVVLFIGAASAQPPAIPGTPVKPPVVPGALVAPPPVVAKESDALRAFKAGRKLEDLRTMVVTVGLIPTKPLAEKFPLAVKRIKLLIATVDAAASVGIEELDKAVLKIDEFQPFYGSWLKEVRAGGASTVVLDARFNSPPQYIFRTKVKFPKAQGTEDLPIETAYQFGRFIGGAEGFNRLGKSLLGETASEEWMAYEAGWNKMLSVVEPLIAEGTKGKFNDANWECYQFWHKYDKVRNLYYAQCQARSKAKTSAVTHWPETLGDRPPLTK